MALKRIQHPDGRTFGFGRKCPLVRFPFPRLKRYLLPNIIPPPTCDYSTAAASSLRQMYKNDILGDCVIAMVEHLEGVLTGNAGEPPLLYTDDQTIAYYSTVCGYNLSDPSTDQGCDVQTVLTYWENNGAPSGSSHKIAGILSVDPTNILECQMAVWLFENLIFGVELPNAWISSPPAPGFIWDIAGDAVPENGHCFPAIGYDSNKFLISTWAMLGHITNAAVTKYCVPSVNGELYTVISQDQINVATQLAPNGFNWAQLLADFQAMGGTTPVVVPPNTAPIPPPDLSKVPGTAQWLATRLLQEDYTDYLASLETQSWDMLKNSY
jgi:hypothetical protein